MAAGHAWTNGDAVATTGVGTTETVLNLKDRNEATVTKLRLWDFAKATWWCENTGATNAITFRLYASVNGTGSPVAAGEPDKNWVLLSTAASVAALKAKALSWAADCDDHFEYFTITGQAAAGTTDVSITWTATTR